MGICVCIYFMKNGEHYQVSWNVLNWLWPSLALEINKGLSQMGTLLPAYL